MREFFDVLLVVFSLFLTMMDRRPPRPFQSTESLDINNYRPPVGVQNYQGTIYIHGSIPQSSAPVNPGVPINPVQNSDAFVAYSYGNQLPHYPAHGTIIEMGNPTVSIGSLQLSNKEKMNLRLVAIFVPFFFFTECAAGKYLKHEKNPICCCMNSESDEISPPNPQNILNPADQQFIRTWYRLSLVLVLLWVLALTGLLITLIVIKANGGGGRNGSICRWPPC